MFASFRNVYHLACESQECVKLAQARIRWLQLASYGMTAMTAGHSRNRPPGDGAFRVPDQGWGGSQTRKGYNPAGDPAGALAIHSEMQVRDQRLAAYPLLLLFGHQGWGWSQPPANGHLHVSMKDRGSGGGGGAEASTAPPEKERRLT